MNDVQETKRTEALFERISALIEQSRQFVASSVNVAEVKTRYEVGRYIFEDEQQGERAAHGKQILKNLSVRLIERFGTDWTYDTLIRCRKFYQAYNNAAIVATALPQLGIIQESADNEDNLNCGNSVAPIRMPHFTLSWSHYLILMRIENPDVRSFYEIECAQQQWSVRQLSRQVGSSLYERLTKSHLFSSDVKDKNEKMRLEAMQKVKVMLNRKALPADYLKDLMKVIQNDGLSGYELRFINQLKPADYHKLPDQIDEYYINRIIETCNHVDDGEESIILAEELR